MPASLAESAAWPVAGRKFPQGAVDAEAAGPLSVLAHWATLKGLIGFPLPTK